MMKTITSILLMALGCYLFAQTPIMHLKYDEANGAQAALDEAGGLSFQISNQFDKPERVSGVTGKGLRTDGFSTWGSRDFAYDYGGDMTMETWISLESYPSDEEVPYQSLTPSAILSQFQGDLGFQLGINTFGVWWFSVNINGEKYTCQAPNPFPLYQWVHVAGVVDSGSSVMKLYLNGQEVASASIPSGGQIQEASVPFLIGKSNVDKINGIFLINALSAAIDETKVYDVARSASSLLADYQNLVSNIPATGFEAVAVPANRFEHDMQRPLYHAMPEANWTNEPHGMVDYNGQYHLFYQRTPNGPFKFQMHWGHMISSDFVNWRHEKDALWPSLEWSATSGYDMKGIWSGDVVVDNGTAHAFYTNVNHTGPYNPGIAHATSSDETLESWTKQGPVIDKQYVDDFRDPYLWKEGNTWHMIIGAAVSGGGGLDYYTSADLDNWTHQSQFSSVAYSQMDVGSAIWEMPVFESLGNGKHILIANPIGGTRGKYGPNYTRGVYWIGTWSNGAFTPDYNQPKNLDVIHGHLSPTVARNMNGELVGIGIVDERWGSQAQLDAGWCHSFSLPRVYSLLADGETLGQAPAPQLQSLRISGTQHSQTNLSVSGTQQINARGQAIEIIAQVNPNTAADKYGINFYVSDGGEEITRLYYDAAAHKIVLNKQNSSLSPHNEEAVLLAGDYDESAFGKPEKFHIYLDHSIIDIFINDKAAFSNRVYPTLTSSNGIQLFSEGGTTTFTSVDTWALGKNGATVAVESVSLDHSSLIVPLTTSASLKATVSPANATDKSLIWTSSNEGVVTVSSSGALTPVSKGSATVTATSVSGGVSASCDIMVVDAPTYLVYDFESGDLSNWNVTGQAFSDADITSDTAWWGGPFNHEGTYHLHGFKDGGDSETGEMTTSVFTLGAHGQIDLLLGGGDDNNNLYVGLYRSAGDSLITRATGKNDETYSKVVLDGSSVIGQSCYLKVVDNATGGFGHLNLDNVRIPVQTGSPVSVTGISVDPASLSLSVQETAVLSENVVPSNATNKTVTWSSNNTSIATVNSSGLVTAVANGQAIITATTDDGGFTAQAGVVVADQDYLIYDFETGDLTGWLVSGDAFTQGDVTTATNWGWGGPFNPQGDYHLWGVASGNDAQTGSLKSQDFVIGGNGVISFMIGGGFDINTVYLALVRTSDGAVLMKATGDDNDSEAYIAKQFDASAYMGTACFLKLVDNATGGWGHINIDNLVIPIDNIPVTSVTLNTNSITLTEGSDQMIIANICPANATTPDVCWSSSSTSIATVNEGIVTGVAPGSATITATTIDGGFTAQATVTVVAQEYLVYDFESGDLTGWSGGGSAFSTADVTSDTDWGWGGPFDHEGAYHLWGVKSGSDTDTGSLQSQDFVLDGDGVISFMIGGGFDINTLYLALVRKSDDVELMKATGENNDSEAYSSKQFNAADYVGTKCYLKVVDNATGGWGHINLDNIRIPIASVDVTGVSIAQSSVTLVEGNSTVLSATVLPVGATNQNVTWSSSNENVAIVNDGLVTGISSGTTTITVTTEEGAYTDQVTVVVEAQGYLVYDFESADLSGWTGTGNAFVVGDVTSDTDWGWGGPFNPQGTYHLWGVKSGSDADTGTLQSQDFVLGGDGIITFMLGGGFDFNNVYLALVRKSDGAELMKVTGDNNDSEAYVQKQMDASAYVGTECYMKLVDNATGGWGHINLDNLRIPIDGNSSSRVAAAVMEAGKVDKQVIKIFPNPVSGHLHFQTRNEGEFQLTILGMDGKVVFKGNLDHSGTIDMEGIHAGMYLLLIQAEDSRQVFRIIKQ